MSDPVFTPQPYGEAPIGADQIMQILAQSVDGMENQKPINDFLTMLYKSGIDLERILGIVVPEDPGDAPSYQPYVSDIKSIYPTDGAMYGAMNDIEGGESVQKTLDGMQVLYEQDPELFGDVPKDTSGVPDWAAVRTELQSFAVDNAKGQRLDAGGSAEQAAWQAQKDEFDQYYAPQTGLTQFGDPTLEDFYGAFGGNKVDTLINQYAANAKEQKDYRRTDVPVASRSGSQNAPTGNRRGSDRGSTSTSGRLDPAPLAIPEQWSESRMVVSPQDQMAATVRDAGRNNTNYASIRESLNPTGGRNPGGRAELNQPIDRPISAGNRVSPVDEAVSAAERFADAISATVAPSQYAVEGGNGSVATATPGPAVLFDPVPAGLPRVGPAGGSDPVPQGLPEGIRMDPVAAYAQQEQARQKALFDAPGRAIRTPGKTAGQNTMRPEGLVAGDLNRTGTLRESDILRAKNGRGRVTQSDANDRPWMQAWQNRAQENAAKQYATLAADRRPSTAESQTARLVAELIRLSGNLNG